MATVQNFDVISDKFNTLLSTHWLSCRAALGVHTRNIIRWTNCPWDCLLWQYYEYGLNYKSTLQMAPGGQFLINNVAASNLLSNKLTKKWNNDNSNRSVELNSHALRKQDSRVLLETSLELYRWTSNLKMWSPPGVTGAIMLTGTHIFLKSIFFLSRHGSRQQKFRHPKGLKEMATVRILT